MTLTLTWHWHSLLYCHTHKSVLSEEHEARSHLSWKKLGHIVVGERKWGRRKQRRGLFKGPKSEQIVPVILIGEFWWVGIFQKNSDPPTSLLTFNVGQICDIFFGKRERGEWSHACCHYACYACCHCRGWFMKVRSCPAESYLENISYFFALAFWVLYL